MELFQLLSNSDLGSLIHSLLREAKISPPLQTSSSNFAEKAAFITLEEGLGSHFSIIPPFLSPACTPILPDRHFTLHASYIPPHPTTFLSRLLQGFHPSRPFLSLSTLHAPRRLPPLSQASAFPPCVSTCSSERLLFPSEVHCTSRDVWCTNRTRKSVL